MNRFITHCKRKVRLACIWLTLKRQRRIISSARTPIAARKIALRRVMELVLERAELTTDAELKRIERKRGLV
jgi:hypothetical protein